MADFQIYIGYRTVSSWSMRGWMPLKKSGVPFDETFIRYRIAEDKKRLAAVSPTARVPLLVHKRPEGDLRIWDSLAIGEYLAELFPAKQFWPADPRARAYARAISAEMHSGFRPLREHLSMALLEAHPGEGINDPGAAADIARIDALWTEARDTWGRKHGGPFLFGHFTIADAMYLPVCTRFRTYMPHLMPTAMRYVEAMLADPDFLVWEERAMTEPPIDPLPA